MTLNIYLLISHFLVMDKVNWRQDDAGCVVGRILCQFFQERLELECTQVTRCSQHQFLIVVAHSPRLERRWTGRAGQSKRIKFVEPH